MQKVEFLRSLKASLEESLAQVQRELDSLNGEKKVKVRQPSARLVVFPTDIDTAAARKAEAELQRNGLLPYGRKTA